MTLSQLERLNLFLIYEFCMLLDSSLALIIMFFLLDYDVVGFLLGPNVLSHLYIESRGGLVWVLVHNSYHHG
jgi:hypothetical protein